ncbi:NAD-dependent deacylase [Dietzia sp.]|uniref:NAD-dependent deacylase n=1 Tax=Dietzia sp. TaxID=1871616 RepID=UPI002FDAB4F1
MAFPGDGTRRETTIIEGPAGTDGSPDTPLPRDLVAAARAAARVEVFTGAGMSADSGLDTFRDANTGIWSNVDPQAMASIDSWARDPEPMWAWYLWRGTLARRAEPNAGHVAVARWGEREDTDVHVTTQNIDDLHERGGSASVAHLHGSLYAFRCSICEKPAAQPEFPTEAAERLAPPSCSLCGNPVRPGVVWFGEALPERDWARAEESMGSADFVVIVGTSGVVTPAANLPHLAAEKGTPILEISPADTALTPLATWSWRTTAAAGLPRLLSALDG